MAAVHENITPELADFIARQPMYFVAAPPLICPRCGDPYGTRRRLRPGSAPTSAWFRRATLRSNGDTSTGAGWGNSIAFIATLSGDLQLHPAYSCRV